MFYRLIPFIPVDLNQFIIPNIIAQISSALASQNINISEYLNKHKDGYAYNIIDTETDISNETIDKIKSIEGIISVRIIDPEGI